MVRPTLRPLLIAAAVTALSTAASYVVPETYSAALVGLVFLAATYWLCLRRSVSPAAPSYGLSLGGLMEDAPLEPLRMVRQTLTALGVALLSALLIFPLFFFAFRLWHDVQDPFSFARMKHVMNAGRPFGWVDLVLGHLLAVALPEEAFFRGYLQTELARAESPAHSKRPWRSIVISSTLFALGHFATFPHPARLAVFFPSLAFGALRARTGGIGASVFFHALCNLYSAALFGGFPVR